ncbi:MAG TPA: SAM-dependent methyltransferase [Cytophagales bacterium]|jgi:SAM-dependent methyltransferase|nr:SAM-dependent methyltransferase [Cytophagales bacterium]
MTFPYKIDFTHRSKDEELMDDLDCNGDVVDQTLRELEFINSWLGGNKVTLNGIGKLIKHNNQNPLRIIDLGCGDGEMLRRVGENINKKNFNTSLLGIDANPNIIEVARNKTLNGLKIEYKAINILDPDFSVKDQDIVICTLFLHHFDSDVLADLLSKWHKQAQIGIVINDLHRHPLAFYSIRLLTAWFSRSPMVKYDAPLSVLRGFTKGEWEDILQKAGIEQYELTWHWAFRWQLIIPSGNS